MSGKKNPKPSAADFDQLEAELGQLVGEESLYWLRNDAKFRAAQNTSSYEEFQNIVKVISNQTKTEKKKIFLSFLLHVSLVLLQTSPLAADGSGTNLRNLFLPGLVGDFLDCQMFLLNGGNFLKTFHFFLYINKL